MFESILCEVTEYDPGVLESMIGLAVEIAREGREGRRVGTLFMLGDENAVHVIEAAPRSLRGICFRPHPLPRNLLLELLRSIRQSWPNTYPRRG
jgi:DNA integrity scanning protein DisA with diadenylate cyclase activity